MPLCPQITNTPITVSLTSDFTVTNVLPVLAANTQQLASTDAAVAAAAAAAASASATAATAQSTATTALADAATAYNTAINSLQPSAYAIQNPTTKQLTSIDATGLTVYSGASATSGARVVLNSTGLAGFNSGGTATFSVSASTGAAVFAGSVTGATITGGTLNIAGNAIIDSSGLLTATGATITGTINATAGYFGTASNGFSINSTGMIGVGGGVISGGIITTSTGSDAVVLDGPNNALGIKYGGSYAGWLVGIGSGQFMMHYGTSPSSTGYPRHAVSSTTASMAADGSNSLSITTSGNNMQGAMSFGAAVTMSNNLTVNSYIYNPGYQVSTAGGAARINDASTPSARLVAASGSSIRFKKDVVTIQDVSELNPRLLLTVPVKAFRYRDDYLDLEDERSGVLVPGLIAEELDAIYPVAVDHDNQGRASRWSSDFIVPGLLALIQEQEARITSLEGK